MEVCVPMVPGAVTTQYTVDKEMAYSLLEWRRLSAFNQQTDWVFASPEKKGQQPYWPENLLRRHIRPAAQQFGIRKTIGWHTFRHYAGLLTMPGRTLIDPSMHVRV